MVEEQMRLVLGQHHVFDSVVGWKEAHLVHKNSCHLSLCFYWNKWRNKTEEYQLVHWLLADSIRISNLV